jgi:HNH endonuclease
MIEITAEYLASQGLSPSFETRFWKKVKKVSPEECWIWTASFAHCGYGQIIKTHGFPIRAHRASWILHRGPIPKGLYVCHKCDNPPCVNPEHLFLGTQKDNSDDKIRKGRFYVGEPRKGELNPLSKLHATGNVTCREIAKMFNMYDGNIRKIVRRELWDHVHFNPP